MHWHRITPKSGNKRYIWVDPETVSEDDLKNIKEISCWFTRDKPKNLKQIVREDCSYIVIFKKRMKTEYKNFEIDTYATFECLKYLFPLQYNVAVNIIEQDRYSYLVIKNFGRPILNMKYFYKKVLNDLFQHTEFRGCKYCREISPDIFLKITRSEYSTKFSQHREKTAENLKCGLEDLERAITEKKAALGNKIKPLNVLIFQKIYETVQERTKAYLNVEFAFTRALQYCRFLSEKSQQNLQFSSNKQLQFFCLSAGTQGKDYLLLKICESTLKTFLAREPKENFLPTDDTVAKKAIPLITEIFYAEKLKPIRCNKQAPWCGMWCGACSPVELIGSMDILKPSFYETHLHIEFFKLGYKFIQRLPRTRFVFRTSELHSWLPKTTRSPFDVSCIISHLIKRQYISPFTPSVTDFKPGKKGRIYWINWKIIYPLGDAVIL